MCARAAISGVSTITVSFATGTRDGSRPTAAPGRRTSFFTVGYQSMRTPILSYSRATTSLAPASDSRDRCQ